MNIIIAGAGKVGFNLAKTLCIGHNVTVIDQNSEALHRLQESLDIMPLLGDVEDSKTYESLVGSKINLFIAVTDNDNVNLISSVVASTILQIDKKFVRIQKQFFDSESIKTKLEIDKLIFPLLLASKAISSLIKYPKANNIKLFKYTQHKLISVMASSTFIPHTFSDENFKIVGIERKKNFFIPQESEIEILPNDLVYLFGLEEKIREACQILELETNNEIQKCVVFGAGELGVSIAKELLEVGRDVKLVEKNLQLCEKADELLQGRASIINSKYATHELFEDEGLNDADIFIAATKDDEYNIIKSLEAKESGIKKVVAINNEMEYYNFMHSLGIIVVRGPKISAYNTIMEDISSTGVVIRKSFCGAKAVVYMRKVFANSKLIGKKIKPLKQNSATVFLMREENLYSLNEKTVLMKDDLVIAFCVIKESERVQQWIYEL